MSEDKATEANPLREHLAKLLHEHIGPITARWAELARESLPVKPALEDAPQDTGESRCAVLVALLDALSDSDAPGLPQYLHTLVRRWHAAGLLGEATRPYFSALQQAVVEVLQAQPESDLSVDDMARVLSTEMSDLQSTLRDMEVRVLGTEREDLQLRLETVLNHVPEPVFMLDIAGGRISHANRAAAELSGYSIDELRGMTMQELCPGLDDAGLSSLMGDVVDYDRAVRRNVGIVRRNAAAIDATIDVSLMNIGPRPVAMCLLTDAYGGSADRAALRVLARDLRSEVRERLNQIERLKTFFENVISALPIRLVVLNSDLTIIHANRAYYVQRGLPKEEVIGKPVGEVISEHTLEKAGLRAALLSVFETGKPVRWSGHRSGSSHQERVVNIRLDPCVGPDGDRTVLLTLEDITERQRQLYERTILQQVSHALLGQLDVHKLLHAILTSMTAGGAVGLGFNRAMLLLVDEEAGMLRAQMAVGPENAEQAAEIWGEISQDHRTLQDFLADYEQLGPPDEQPLRWIVDNMVFALEDVNNLPMAAVVAHQTMHVLDADVDERVPDNLRELLGTSEFVVAPLVAREKIIGAAIADNRFTQQPISQASVQLLTALADQAALAIDTASTYRRAKEHAEQLDQALRDLRAAQEDKLRNAKLAAIGEVTAIVAHEIRSPLSTIGGFARSIIREPERVERNARNVQIIADEVARLEWILGDLLDFSKPSEPEFAMLDLRPLIESVIEQERYNDKSDGIELVTEIPDFVPQILADGKQVRQILTNLIHNAMDAMPGGGIVTISVRGDDEHVDLHVRDTGVGIAKARLEQIFDTFYTSKPTGTGLGLALCQKLVAQHDGELKVESEVGQGATFTVRFPNPSAGLAAETGDEEESAGLPDAAADGKPTAQTGA